MKFQITISHAESNLDAWWVSATLTDGTVNYASPEMTRCYSWQEVMDVVSALLKQAEAQGLVPQIKDSK